MKESDIGIVLVFCVFGFFIWWFRSNIRILLSATPITSGDGGTPNTVAAAGSIEPIGCYTDKADRAMPYRLFGENEYTSFDNCKQRAMEKGYKYFALQSLEQIPDFASDPGLDQNARIGTCWASNDPTNIKKYGESTNCESIPNTDKMGGKQWANYVYKLL